MEYAGYKKYGKFVDREVLHADQLNVLWDGIRQNGSEIDKIYKELSVIDVNEIDSSMNILGFKGKITVEHFLELPSAKQGEIYQIEDEEANINYFNNKWNLSLKNGDFLICTKNFNNTIKITKENIKEYWKINTQTIFSNASSFESGMVNTGNQSFSGNKVFNNNVTILGKLQLSNNEIYIGGTPVIIPDNNIVLQTLELLKDARKRIEVLEGGDQGLLEEIKQLEDTITVVNGALTAFRSKTTASFSELTERYNAEIAHIYKMLADFDERLKNLYVKTEIDKSQLTVAFKEADEQLKQELLLDHDEINTSIDLAAQQVKREFNLADDVVRAEMQDADAILRHDFETADINIKNLIKKTEEEIRIDFTQADKEIINAFTSADEVITNRTTEEFSKVRSEVDVADRQIRIDYEAADAAIISSFYSANAKLKETLLAEDQRIREDFRAGDAAVVQRVNNLHDDLNALNEGLTERVNQTVADALSTFNKDENFETEIIRNEFKEGDEKLRSEFAIADENVREEIYRNTQTINNNIEIKNAQLEAGLRKDFFEANNNLKTDISGIKERLDLTNTAISINSSKISSNTSAIQTTETQVEKNTAAITTNTDDISVIKERVYKIDEDIATAVVDAKNDLAENYTKAISAAKEEVTSGYTSKISTLTKLVTTADTELKNQANTLEEKVNVITEDNSNIKDEQTKIKEDIQTNLANIQDNTRRIIELETNGPANPNPNIPVGNAGIERMTEEEYNSLAEKDPNKFYFIIENNEPLYLYIGTFLIAKKGEVVAQGFPYIFPIIF